MNFSKGVSLQRGGRFDWDFGDGQKGTGTSPTHVYLAPGDYAVTLKVSGGTRSSTFRTTVRVERNWWKQTEKEIDPPKAYAEQAAAYNLASLDLPSLRLAVSLFEHEKMAEPLVAAASELALKRKDVPVETLRSTCLLLGRLLREGKRAQEAVAAYRQVEGRLSTRPTRPTSPSRFRKPCCATSTSTPRPRRSTPVFTRRTPPAGPNCRCVGRTSAWATCIATRET